MREPSEINIGPDDEPSLRVECYAGHRADTEPRRLYIGQREVLVIEIIDRWLEPRYRYFKLRGEDGAMYLLRQDTLNDRWETTLYDGGHHDETRFSYTRTTMPGATHRLSGTRAYVGESAR